MHNTNRVKHFEKQRIQYFNEVPWFLVHPKAFGDVISSLPNNREDRNIGIHAKEFFAKHTTF